MASEQRTYVTHGRHCACSSCAREDWTNPDLASCGMHGEDCPALYQPLGRAGDVLIDGTVAKGAEAVVQVVPTRPFSCQTPGCDRPAVVRVAIARDRGTALCTSCADEVSQYIASKIEELCSIWTQRPSWRPMTDWLHDPLNLSDDPTRPSTRTIIGRLLTPWPYITFGTAVMVDASLRVARIIDRALEDRP